MTYEQQARLVKASKIEQALVNAWDALPASDTEGRSLVEALEFGAYRKALWEAAVKVAGVRKPSDKTKALVLQGLRVREKIVADPFAFFGA